MPAQLAVPPLDGSTTVLPGFVDFQAKHNSSRPWALFPPTSASKRTFFTYGELADATHRIAHTYCPDGVRANGEIMAVIAHPDSILYLALVAGLARAGFVPFPMSPRNSLPALVNLLDKTGCHHIITQPHFSSLVDSVKAELAQKQHNLQIYDLPDFHKIFPSFTSDGEFPVEPFPGPSRPHDLEDIVLYSHSSGSTGLPKPIAHRHNSMIQLCTCSVITETKKRGLIWGLMALPTFHAVSIFMQLYNPLATSQAIALNTPMAPGPPVMPTPDNILEACKATPINAVTAVPVFVEAWGKSEDAMKFLSKMQIIIYAGGPLSEAGGNRLVKAGVPVYACYGGTEYGAHSIVFDADDSQGPDAPVKTSMDWQWMAFPDYVRCRWVPQGDGNYECQFLTVPTHRPAVENLPDTRGYATSDLFVPHPTKKGLWRITGRKDDVLVLGIGEKVVTIPQESLIVSSPLVSGCVMFGHGKNECGVLIEPRDPVSPDDPTALAEFRKTIWPVVENANKVAPGWARIYKEMVLVTDPAKPLPRVVKGTVMRVQALKMYEEEIENLYRTIADSADVRGIPPPASWTPGDIEPWLMKLAASVNGEVEISSSKDMFDQGFDSLHATFLRNRIVGTLRASSDDVVQQAVGRITQNFVFEHPTLRELAHAIADAVLATDESNKRNLEKQIQTMLEHYASYLPKPLAPAGAVYDPNNLVVLLTGSTGNVGSHILAALLKETRVRKVFVLNRPSASPQERQAAAFRERGLSAELLSDTKLVLLSGDVTQERLGLNATDFEEIKNSVTCAIHNAWRVDFNLSLSSLEKYIASTRRLIEFCCLLPRRVRLLFTSSIAAAHNWDVTRGSVPEEILSDTSLAPASGYGASKFIGENILGEAVKNGMECTSLRIGQVCGSKSTGAWGTTEWVPIVVKSSVALGMLPDLDGPVSWIPADSVATAVTELLTAQTHLPPLVNVVHPHPVAWSTVFQSIGASLGEKPLPLVPYSQWLSALESVAAQGNKPDLERVPALKILQFLHHVAELKARAATAENAAVEAGGSPTFETSKLQQLSPSVKSLEPLHVSHPKAWVAYWNAQGYF